MTICNQRCYMLKCLKGQGLPSAQLNIFCAIIISRILYVLHAWGGFLTVELTNKIDIFSARLTSGDTHRKLPLYLNSCVILMRNYSLKWGVVTILSISCYPRLKHYPWNSAQPIVCLLSRNVITTCINLHLFCEICFWTLIEIFCFYTMFITFVRWRLSVGIKRFTYLLT